MISTAIRISLSPVETLWNALPSFTPLKCTSPTSHVAILARSRGVPMIVGVDVDHLENGRDQRSQALVLQLDQVVADVAQIRSDVRMLKCTAGFPGDCPGQAQHGP